jgi:hypothetical protein
MHGQQNIKIQGTGLWNDVMSTVEITEHRMRLFSTIKDEYVIHELWINVLSLYCPGELKAVCVACWYSV